MRLAGIDTIEAANQFLELPFIPEWEQRFTVAPRQSRNVHRRLEPEHRLAGCGKSAFRCHSERSEESLRA